MLYQLVPSAEYTNTLPVDGVAGVEILPPATKRVPLHPIVYPVVILGLVISPDQVIPSVEEENTVEVFKKPAILLPTATYLLPL